MYMFVSSYNQSKDMNKETFMKWVASVDQHIVWADVADRANLSENTVVKYKKGRRGDSNTETMEKIVDAGNSLLRAKGKAIEAILAA